MSIPSLSRPGAALAAVFTVVLVVAVLWRCDLALRAGERHAPAAPAVNSGAALEGAPVFILFIDSLRYQTAMDPAVMPALAALRRNGLSARVNTVYQGHTVPAIRALFTGGAPSGVFNVITDFRRSDLSLASLFSELRAHHRSSIAWSSGQFNQFGSTIEQRFVDAPPAAFFGGDPMLVRDQARVRAALAVFAERRHALVIAHVEFTDYAGHQFGTTRPEYRDYFARADALIRAAAQSVPPDCTLVVLGDHGHDERGEHKAGIAIPTTAVFRGPVFRGGVDAGTVEISHLGYWLRAALDLPLNRARFPHVLLDRGLKPGAEPQHANSEDEPGSAQPLSLGVLLAVVALAAIAWRLWHDPPLLAHALAWPSLAILFWPGTPAPWLAVAGAVATGLALRPALTVWAIPLGGAMALVRWGGWLTQAPGTVPLSGWLVRLAWVAAAIIVWRRPPRERVGWLAGAAAIALWGVEPWEHAAGWLAASIFAGLGLLWLTLTTASLGSLGALAFAAVALVFATTLREAGPGQWALAVPRGGLETLPLGFAAGIAKFLLLRRLAPATRGGLALTLIITAALVALGWQLDRSALDWHPRIATTAFAVGFSTAWLVLRARGSPAWRPLVGLAALFAWFCHGVRADPYFYAWADLLFAGLFLAAHRAESAAARVSLGFGALAVSYVLAQGWLPGGVEWQALYDWFPAETVESHVGWFLPWILFRETLPFWVARYCLTSAWGDRSWPAIPAARLLALWMIGLALIAAGHFHATPAIEATQLPAEQLAGLGVLLFAALVGRRQVAAQQTVSKNTPDMGSG